MKNKIIITLLASVSLGGVAMPAMAQETKDSAEASNANADIIVTASRRKERLQDVPLAVSAVTAKQLASTGFKDLTNIAYTFSGVEHGDSPNDAGYRVRGVGQLGGFTSASEQPVGLVVDNVVVGIGNPVNSLGDLERIEVLKGPQGTQFGKNASSGVINITTARPNMDAVGGSIFASYGSLEERDIHGSINLPVSSNAALNIFAYDRANDGFIQNTVLNKKWGGGENYGARAKFLFEPSDDFSIYIIGDYARTHQDGPGQTWTLNKLTTADAAPGGIFGLPFVNLAALGVTPSDSNNVSIENTDTSFDADNYGASVQLDWKMGGHTLTSVSAFRGYKEQPYTYGIDGAPYTKFNAKASGELKRFFSEELRLTSPSGNTIEYVGGLYLSRQETGRGNGQSATLSPALPYNPFPTISITNGYNVTNTTTDSQALFVDGKIHLADTLSILGGARVTHDVVNSSNYSYADTSLAPFVAPAPSNGFTPSGTLPYTPKALQSGRITKTNVSGRVGLEYKPDNNLLFFGTYARGYLGPTVTFSGLTGTKSNVAPQTVDDLTVGAKMQFLNRTLTLNANVFYDKYKDLQTSVFNGTEFLTENAGGAEVKGFEVEMVARPVRNFSANVSLTYSDAKFTDYITACPTPILIAGTQLVNCNATGSTSSTPLYQAAGQVLPGAPLYTIVAGVNYDHPISDSLKLDMSGNISFRSKTQSSVGDINTVQKAYSIVNLSAGIGNVDGKWRLGVFARNLFKANFNSAIIGLPFSNNGDYVNWRTRESSRTLGVSLEGKF